VIQPLPAVHVTDVTAEMPVNPERHYNARALSGIDLIVVHHTATPPDVSPSRIAHAHIRRGWPGIGYHYLVSAGGTLYQVNALSTHAYHAAGYNMRSVGVCLLGSFMDEPPPPEQLMAAARIIGWLLAQLNLTLAAVVGHRDIMATACPGDTWHHWREALALEIEAWQTTQ